MNELLAYAITGTAWLILFFGTLWIHELGHKFAFKIFGRETKTKLQWYGASEGTQKDVFALNIRQLMIVYMMGPLFGAIPAHLTGNTWFIQVYWLSCAVDLVHVFELQTIDKKYWKWNYLRYCKHLLKRYA